MKIKFTYPYLIIIATLVLFIFSSIRHILFQSNALDLGWFDQGVYLISQGKPPIVSFVNFHILGDHAALILYPIALLYKIYPSVYWLLLVQALGLSVAIWPIEKLCGARGLTERQTWAVLWVYLLYPLVFNVNLADFHPEVIAVPAIFWAIWALRSRNLSQFCLALILILSTKAILSLTVVGIGIWALVTEKNKAYGIIAVIAGGVWFYIATEVIIPTLTQTDAAVQMADDRYQYLGNSVGEILTNLVFKPYLISAKIFSGANLEYLILLLIPAIWGLSPRHLSPLIAAAPALLLNLITDYAQQKNLPQQYSLPVLPFLILIAIDTIAANRHLIKKPKYIILWSLVSFLALAKYGYFTSIYLKNLDTWQATRNAINEVKSDAGVFTNAAIAPHLTHRQEIKLAIDGAQNTDFNAFGYVILNRQHPGWSSSPQLIDEFINTLKKQVHFTLQSQEKDVFLFVKKP
ncbi:MAG: hypothetical protein N5P05_002471 [Chroococcopsis gigantea SAG 12.99]|nr:hypothetical protein [Chroococcopsis gigantea SAG 12.99]